MEGKVAVYVQGRYAKPAYKVESYDTRAWPGLELVCHALRQAGIEVGYCSAATVDRYRVVLVSCQGSSMVKRTALDHATPGRKNNWTYPLFRSRRCMTPTLPRHADAEGVAGFEGHPPAKADPRPGRIGVPLGGQRLAVEAAGDPAGSAG